jgi:F1-F0 ATPase (N-ATPase) AtpR subunit
MSALLDAGCFGLGIVAGLLHFHLLRWNTHLFITGGALRAFGVQALRLAGLAGVLVLAAWLGALPLVLAALGVMIARLMVVSPRWDARLRRAARGGTGP